MWQVIAKVSKQQKKSAVILTTHSMEEADILGDRIAIMKKGRMECIGSETYMI